MPRALLAVTLLLSACLVVAAPEVLPIDDFEQGIDRWENQDTGKLEWVDDAPQGKKAMRWTAGDDGVGHIVYKNLDRQQIDFSKYQLLSFRVKLTGKPAWNVNPVVQQYPAVFGYRGLFYTIDTLMPFGEWVEVTQDLRRWENAWPDTFSRDHQEFQFEVFQLAGAGATQVWLDDIRLLQNPLGLEPSYPGTHGLLADGSQATHFQVALHNHGERPLTVTAKLREGSLERFRVELPAPLRLLPGERALAQVRVIAPAGVLGELPAWYGETAIVGFSVAEIPGLTLFTELTAGTVPAGHSHPCILATPDHVARWRQQWADPEQRRQMDKAFLDFVQRAEAALVREPQYPLLAHTGTRACPKDGTKLVEIAVPSAPFRIYQCETCGQGFSGPMFDAGMQGWLQEHAQNAADAKFLGLGYAVTKRPEFAVAAARILRRYAEVYPQLPVMATSQGSPVHSRTSGATRIGGTYMRERNWLTDLAVALDFVQPAGVLSEADREAIATKVFAPSANNMMDHKVGAMNLQWMIASAGLYAGLAADHPGVTARAMYSSHGVRNLLRVGYLPDGNWWENPSYQNVCNGIAFPVLATCLHNRIMPWTPELKAILTAQFRAYGPDGRGPTLGTGGPGSWNYSVNGLHSLAGMLDDPELAWVPHHLKMWRAGGRGGLYHSYQWALTWSEEPKLPKEQTRSPIPEETIHFEDYGGLAMRLPGTDRYCWFHYGRELTHGHRNKLSVNAYGKGGWYVRNIAGGYGDNFKEFLETIASSTSVMVDSKNADWDTGELLYQQSAAEYVAASGREVGAWKEVEHERSVVLTQGPLIVIDRLQGPGHHRYEWLYQSSGCNLAWQGPDAPAHTEPLGESPLYSSLHPDRRVGTPATVAYARKDGSGLQIAFEPAGELFAFKALKRKEIPGLLWRREGGTVGFLAAYWPRAKDEAGEVTLVRLPVTAADGQEVGVEQGQAVRVTAPEGQFTVLVNYTGKPLRAGTLKSAERVSVHLAKP